MRVYIRIYNVYIRMYVHWNCKSIENEKDSVLKREEGERRGWARRKKGKSSSACVVYLFFISNKSPCARVSLLSFSSSISSIPSSPLNFFFSHTYLLPGVGIRTLCSWRIDVECQYCYKIPHTGRSHINSMFFHSVNFPFIYSIICEEKEGRVDRRLLQKWI